MKRKIVTIILLIGFIIPMVNASTNTIISQSDNPQITDETGDAFGYIDINSVWFFEDEDTPEFLYVSMKINDPIETIFQQTFGVFWKHYGIQYSCGLHVGFDFQEWEKFNSGKYDKRDLDLETINGTYDYSSGIITWIIPKSIIGDPVAGDVLSDTWSNAFRRLGIIGRIGFTRVILDSIIFQVFGNAMWDYAPERGGYGESYVIQY